MGARASRNQQTKYYKWNVVKNKEDKDYGTPFFLLQEKRGEEYVFTERWGTMTGILKDVHIKKTPWQGKTITNLVLVMEDDEAAGEGIQIELGMSFAARSLLNSLAGINEFGVLQFVTWLGKANAEGKRYPLLFVNNNFDGEKGEKCEWRFKMEEIPAVETIKNRAGEFIAMDDAEANDFFEEVIKSYIMPALKGSPPPSTAQPRTVADHERERDAAITKEKAEKKSNQAASGGGKKQEEKEDAPSPEKEDPFAVTGEDDGLPF